VKELFAVSLWVSGLVTTTSFEPAGRGGVMQVIEVAETTLTPVHVEPPTVTVAPVTKPVPVIVINVPPARGPLEGATELTFSLTAAFAGADVVTALNRLAINATTRMIALGALDLSSLWVISMAFWSLGDEFIRVFQKCRTLSEMSKKCV